MNLESPSYRVKSSQKEKNKYRVLAHIYGTQKNGTDEPICTAGIEKQMERMDVWTQGGARRGCDGLGE